MQARRGERQERLAAAGRWSSGSRRPRSPTRSRSGPTTPSSSPFFGTVYVCWASFVGQEKGNAAPAPLQVAVSHDGGDTWTQHQISAAANNGQRNPEDGCTIRTDSRGNAYVFGVGTSPRLARTRSRSMSRSTNGGQTWSRSTPGRGPGRRSPACIDPVQGRPVIDGVAGARSDLAPAPSVDIANGAPTGADATNRIVMSYVSGTLAAPHVYFTESTDHGGDLVDATGDRDRRRPRALHRAGDLAQRQRRVRRLQRLHDAVPDRTPPTHARWSAWCCTPTLASDRADRGVHARCTAARRAIHAARARTPSTDEFLGDYVYATATRTYGAAVWNDARNAADCPAIDACGAWRCRTGASAAAAGTAAGLPGRHSATPTSSAGRTRIRRRELAISAAGLSAGLALSPASH